MRVYDGWKAFHNLPSRQTSFFDLSNDESPLFCVYKNNKLEIEWAGEYFKWSICFGDEMQVNGLASRKEAIKWLKMNKLVKFYGDHK